MALMRGASPGLLAALASPVFYPVLMVNLDWPSGEVWCHTNRGTLVWGGAEYLGVGPFGKVSLPGEQGGLAVSDATILIYGAADAVLDHLEEQIKNRPGRVLFGCVTARHGHVLVDDPCEIFAGYMDASKVLVSESGAEQLYALELTLGTGPGARVMASITHSLEDQRTAYPGDTAGRHTQFALPNARKVTWPA